MIQTGTTIPFHVQLSDIWNTLNDIEKISNIKEIFIWHYTRLENITAEQIALNSTEVQYFKILLDQLYSRYIPGHLTKLNSNKGLLLFGKKNNESLLKALIKTENYFNNVLHNTNKYSSYNIVEKSNQIKITSSCTDDADIFCSNTKPIYAQELISDLMLFINFGKELSDIKIMGNFHPFMKRIIEKRYINYCDSIRQGITPKTTILSTHLSQKEVIIKYGIETSTQLFEMCELINYNF